MTGNHMTFDKFKDIAFETGISLNTLAQWHFRTKIPMRYKLDFCVRYPMAFSPVVFDAIEDELAVRKRNRVFQPRKTFKRSA